MRQAAARFVARWILLWHIGALVTYVALIGLTFTLWPASDLTIQVTVLVSGFLSGLGALASVLVAAETTPRSDSESSPDGKLEP